MLSVVDWVVTVTLDYNCFVNIQLLIHNCFNKNLVMSKLQKCIWYSVKIGSMTETATRILPPTL